MEQTKEIQERLEQASQFVVGGVEQILSGHLMEYISGIPLQKIIGYQETSYDVHRIADRLSKALLQQILQGGCFHGDPHPGNILISPGDKIALLDFGITGHLTRTMRGQILSLMSALIRGNNALILETISQMGIVSEQVDKLAFQTDISALRHGIHIPSEFILVGKSLITLEGILNELDPP
ncbi:MAG: putative unusual protein kinase [Firmicutes bacterium]|nr:putative unusual protein kinase [Bacillota bacterium]